MNNPKLFTIWRNQDESGVSGTGRVLDGVLFHNGQVVVCWRTDIDNHGHSSLGVYPSWEAFKFIHIDSHPTNDTEIIWENNRINFKGMCRGAYTIPLKIFNKNYQGYITEWDINCSNYEPMTVDINMKVIEEK